MNLRLKIIDSTATIIQMLMQDYCSLTEMSKAAGISYLQCKEIICIIQNKFVLKEKNLKKNVKGRIGKCYKLDHARKIELPPPPPPPIIENKKGGRRDGGERPKSQFREDQRCKHGICLVDGKPIQCAVCMGYTLSDYSACGNHGRYLT